MNKVAAAKQARRRRAYGGGGVASLGAGFYGVLVAEAEARPPDDRRGQRRTAELDRLVRPRSSRPGDPDRAAGRLERCGYAVERVEETPGAIASLPARARGPPGQPPRRSASSAPLVHLAAQIDRALPIEPEVLVIMIGGNDVTHTVLPSQSVRYLSRGRTPPHSRRRQGRRRHLPRPRHHPADRPSASTGRPHLVPAAGGRPDDRHHQGRRTDGALGSVLGPGVRGRAGGPVRPRPVPPVRRPATEPCANVLLRPSSPPSTRPPERRSPSRPTAVRA